MGLRFRRSFKVFPGVRLNVSKGGLSTSFGVHGATLNVGKRGVRATVGIPGTGLSYSANLAPPMSGNLSLPNNSPVWAPPTLPSVPGHGPLVDPYITDPGMNEIGSSAVEWLTSQGLQDFRDMIKDAHRQRCEIKEDLTSTQRELRARERELSFKNSILRFIFKKRVAELLQIVPEHKRHIGELNTWHEVTHIEVTFDTGDQASRAYGALVRAYDTCRTCSVIWDVTADRATDRVAERTTATRTVDRRRVHFQYDDSALIRFEGRALRLTNANGDDLLIYPGMILIPRVDGEFALIDLREVVLRTETVSFIETEGVPPDSKVVGQTWAKANKDGSPDRRFANNYQIPVCEYGRLHFTSKSGLNEEFQLSNSGATLAFGQAFTAYASALSGAIRSKP